MTVVIFYTDNNMIIAILILNNAFFNPIKLLKSPT